MTILQPNQPMHTTGHVEQDNCDIPAECCSKRILVKVSALVLTSLVTRYSAAYSYASSAITKRRTTNLLAAMVDLDQPLCG